MKPKIRMVLSVLLAVILAVGVLPVQSFAADPGCEEWTCPFPDVPEDSFCYVPVVWAAKHEFAVGTPSGDFQPDRPCTRAEVMTFLWRVKDQPEPVSKDNPFADVPDDSYYTKAVLWAAENGITTGLDSTHFAPDSPCTRAQAVTFLFRDFGCTPPASDDNPFADVVPGHYYYEPVLWAFEHSLTRGVTENTFAPDALCTRAQIVTFLFRTYR